MSHLDFFSFGLPTWIAVVAALAACLSAFSAYKNSATGRKALALSKETSRLSNANIRTYLIDAFRYRIKDTGMTLYVFCISFENKSTAPNSITEAELRIPFLKDSVERVAVFRHLNSFDESVAMSIQNVVQVPIPLSARGGLTGNFCFQAPHGILEGSEYGPFRLSIKHAEGSPSELEVNLIMDVVDAEHLEKKRRTGVPI
jgi:hypothetical protein